jgi:hypothetical protein
MITLKEWMEVVGYRVTEGGDFGWQCFGDHAYCLSAWNGDHEGWSFNITFDNKTQVVYMVEACDYKLSRAYRLINPIYKDHYMKSGGGGAGEYRDQAWDDVNYVDLETDEDWLAKGTAIADGEPYDDRIEVPVDFSDDELLKYMKLAHERDITFNQLVEEALRNAISEFEQDPEGIKQRAKEFNREHSVGKNQKF